MQVEIDCRNFVEYEKNTNKVCILTFISLGLCTTLTIIVVASLFSGFSDEYSPVASCATTTKSLDYRYCIDLGKNDSSSGSEFVLYSLAEQYSRTNCVNLTAKQTYYNTFCVCITEDGTLVCPQNIPRVKTKDGNTNKNWVIGCSSVIFLLMLILLLVSTKIKSIQNKKAHRENELKLLQKD